MTHSSNNTTSNVSTTTPPSSRICCQDLYDVIERLSATAVADHKSSNDSLPYGGGKDENETIQCNQQKALSLKDIGVLNTKPIDWQKVILPKKRDLMIELVHRIIHKRQSDVTITINQVKFECNLLVLQCHAKSFDQYASIKRIEIPEKKCNAKTFRTIYDWMISTDTRTMNNLIDITNILDILKAANYMRIDDLISQCWALIDSRDVFEERTAFILYIDAKSKNMNEIMQLMLPRVQQYFRILIFSDDWVNLHVDDIVAFISSNYISVHCEIEILMAAVRWLKYDLEHREQYKFDILKCIRFGNIPPCQLIDIKQNTSNYQYFVDSSNDDDPNDVNIRKLIDDGLAYSILKRFPDEHNEYYLQSHYNSLDLNEPEMRNWINPSKPYFTYHEYRLYLEQMRKNSLLIDKNDKNYKKKISKM